MQKEQEQIIIDKVKEDGEDIKIPIGERQEGAEKMDRCFENIDEAHVSPTAVFLEEKNKMTKTNEDNSIASLVTIFREKKK